MLHWKGEWHPFTLTSAPEELPVADGHHRGHPWRATHGAHPRPVNPSVSSSFHSCFHSMLLNQQLHVALFHLSIFRSPAVSLEPSWNPMVEPLSFHQCHVGGAGTALDVAHPRQRLVRLVLSSASPLDTGGGQQWPRGRLQVVQGCN